MENWSATPFVCCFNFVIDEMEQICIEFGIE
jgi:hypothetical protein